MYVVKDLEGKIHTVTASETAANSMYCNLRRCQNCGFNMPGIGCSAHDIEHIMQVDSEHLFEIEADNVSLDDQEICRLIDKVMATTTPPPGGDPVSHPTHYTCGGVECIDAIEAAIHVQAVPEDAFLTAQVIKYLWRWPLKNGVEDLRKAKWYLERLIRRQESDEQE